MTSHSDVFLTECVLVGFLEDPGYVDLSMPKLMDAFPTYSARRIDDDEDSKHSAEARFFLEPQGNEEETALIAGLNTIGVSALKYPSWPRFRDQALEALERSREAYGMRRYRRYLLRYVDVFHATTLSGLADYLVVSGSSVATGLHLVEGNFQYGNDRLIEGLKSVAMVRYSIQRVLLTNDDDPEVLEERFIAAATFDVAASFDPTTESEKARTWLDGAHDWHKELFWHALAPGYRQGPGRDLFDSDEREKFSRQNG